MAVMRITASSRLFSTTLMPVIFTTVVGLLVAALTFVNPTNLVARLRDAE